MQKISVYNEFLLSKQDSKFTTYHVGGLLQSFVKKIKKDDKNWHNHQELIEQLINNVIDLFDRIVYRPSFNRPVFLKNLDFYLSDNLANSEQFLHDLIHEAFDPGISGTFGEDIEDEPEEGFSLENYYSEHATQFVGNNKSTEWLSYGLDAYIREKLRNVISDYVLDNDNVSLEEVKALVLNKLENDGEDLKSVYKNIHKIVIQEAKKLFFENSNIDEKYLPEFLTLFSSKLAKAVRLRFIKATTKNLPNNLFDDNQIVIVNRVKMFLQVLAMRINNGSIIKMNDFQTNKIGQIVDSLYKLASLNIQDSLKLFGLNHQSTVGDLEKSYKKKVFELHPDRAENKEEANAKFVEMQAAYNFLKTFEAPKTETNSKEEKSKNNFNFPEEEELDLGEFINQQPWRHEYYTPRDQYSDLEKWEYYTDPEIQKGYERDFAYEQEYSREQYDEEASERWENEKNRAEDEAYSISGQLETKQIKPEVLLALIKVNEPEMVQVLKILGIESSIIRDFGKLSKDKLTKTNFSIKSIVTAAVGRCIAENYPEKLKEYLPHHNDLLDREWALLQMIPLDVFKTTFKEYREIKSRKPEEIEILFNDEEFLESFCDHIIEIKSQESPKSFYDSRGEWYNLGDVIDRYPVSVVEKIKEQMIKSFLPDTPEHAKKEIIQTLDREMKRKTASIHEIVEEFYKQAQISFWPWKKTEKQKFNDIEYEQELHKIKSKLKSFNHVNGIGEPEIKTIEDSNGTPIYWVITVNHYKNGPMKCVEQTFIEAAKLAIDYLKS